MLQARTRWFGYAARREAAGHALGVWLRAITVGRRSCWHSARCEPWGVVEAPVHLCVWPKVGWWSLFRGQSLIRQPRGGRRP